MQPHGCMSLSSFYIKVGLALMVQAELWLVVLLAQAELWLVALLAQAELWLVALLAQAELWLVSILMMALAELWMGKKNLMMVVHQLSLCT